MWVCEYVDVYRCVSMWGCLSVGLWVCECMSVWVCECVSVWVCECMSVWVCECVSVKVDHLMAELLELYGAMMEIWVRSPEIVSLCNLWFGWLLCQCHVLHETAYLLCKLWCKSILDCVSMRMCEYVCECEYVGIQYLMDFFCQNFARIHYVDINLFNLISAISSIVPFL